MVANKGKNVKVNVEREVIVVGKRWSNMSCLMQYKIHIKMVVDKERGYNIFFGLYIQYQDNLDISFLHPLWKNKK